MPALMATLSKTFEKLPYETYPETILGNVFTAIEDYINVYGNDGNHTVEAKTYLGMPVTIKFNLLNQVITFL